MIGGISVTSVFRGSDGNWGVILEAEECADRSVSRDLKGPPIISDVSPLLVEGTGAIGIAGTDEAVPSEGDERV